MYEKLIKSVLYNPLTGLFYDNNCVLLSKPTKREVRVYVDGKQYEASRLAWLYMTGKNPINEIDHIDGNRFNNEWSNLREATRQQNSQNRHGPQKNSSTKVLGVFKSGKKFKAQIVHNKQSFYLGTYKTKEEAYKVYLAVKISLHPFNTLEINNENHR